jgi:hypothetical protein
MESRHEAMLAAAHIAINDAADGPASTKLEAEYVQLFGSHDFLEGRNAEAESRIPLFEGR